MPRSELYRRLASESPVGHRRTGRQKRDTSFRHIDPRIAVNRQRKTQLLGERRLEVMPCAEPSAKLALQRGPAHRRRTFECVEAVGLVERTA
jgi:hypothetical protein